MDNLNRQTRFTRPKPLFSGMRLSKSKLFWTAMCRSVQVSTKTSKETAHKLAQQLKSKGYAVYVVQAEVKGQTYHRVRIGPFSAQEEAESVRQSLTRHDAYRDAYLAID